LYRVLRSYVGGVSGWIHQKAAHSTGWIVLCSGDVGSCNECGHREWQRVDIYLLRKNIRRIDAKLRLVTSKVTWLYSRYVITRRVSPILSYWAVAAPHMTIPHSTTPEGLLVPRTTILLLLLLLLQYSM
jgi:hypothetical protein